MMFIKKLLIGLATLAVVFILAYSVRAADTCKVFNGYTPGNSTCTFAAQATDPERDNVYYLFSWGDGTPTIVPDPSGPLVMPANMRCDSWTPGQKTVPSGTWCYADHTYGQGSFTPFVIAYDEANHESEYSESGAVTITSSGSPPNKPVNILPANNSFTSTGTNFTWSGGDPNPLDVVVYKVYVSLTGNPGQLYGTVSTTCVTCNITLTPTSPPFPLVAGSVYDWYVTADDTPITSPPTPTYPGRPVRGDTTRFTVNRPPVVSNVKITPLEVDKTATITWRVTDPDVGQSLTYSLSYSASSDVPSSANVIATGNIAMPICTYALQGWWDCTYEWNSNSNIDPACQPGDNGVPWYIVVQANDGWNSDAKSPNPSSTFTFVHTHTVYQPSASSYGNVDVAVNDTVNFDISDGSIKPSSSFITYRGASCSVTLNPSARANNGPAAGYKGKLPNRTASPPIELNNLIPNTSNKLVFSVEGCGQVQYQLHYNLASSCKQPYVATQQGSIYSSGDITARYAPPADRYNATYFILGGTTGTPRIIQNFITQPQPTGIETWNPAFRQLAYPGTSSSDYRQSRVGSFDYYGLTHHLDGKELADGDDTNLYGHHVFTLTGDVSLKDGIPFSDMNSVELAGMVVYIRKGSLTVDADLTFANAKENISGAGLFIVDNDLRLNADTMSYAEPVPEALLKNLASVGWLVRGNINIASNVSQLVGAFYAAGTVEKDFAVGGIIDTGGGTVPLTVYGTMIARQFHFERSASSGGEPSEKVVADGRVLVNTPPGFSDLLRTLPSWQFRAP